MVATRSSTRSANSSQPKKTSVLEKGTSVKTKGSRRSTAVKPPPSSRKVGKKAVTRRKPRLSVEDDPEAAVNENLLEDHCLHKNPSSDEPVPLKKPRKSEKLKDEQEEEKQSVEKDECVDDTEASNDVAKSDVKVKNGEDSDQWEDFGNTSEEDEAKSNLHSGKKKQSKKGRKTTKDKVQGLKKQEPALRRSGRKVIRKEPPTKIEGIEGSSSSSDSVDSESDDSADVGRSEPETGSESSEKDDVSYDSDESFDVVRTKKPKISQNARKRSAGSQRKTSASSSGKARNSGGGF
ncbi:hypothetical protein Y032_0023g674 [Ancylostoma ceylanicum]|uniref:Uncharacterized protein n=1 Tax=Ancylostoma ceylanicum TaxID=53326 RepID=A0A016UY53_9BILA|nr:hypothetical protein Y032_0023g674 [Ancylostoma ceylanicum]